MVLVLITCYELGGHLYIARIWRPLRKCYLSNNKSQVSEGAIEHVGQPHLSSASPFRATPVPFPFHSLSLPSNFLSSDFSFALLSLP